MRRETLAVNEFYHIFTKSIAEFKIFNSNTDFSRMLNLMRYYQREKPPIKFSKFIKSDKIKQKYSDTNDFLSNRNKIVEIIAYCIMPTHLHLILKQVKEDGISTFISNILNSYSHYFNLKYRRKGPLWEGRFKSILVETDEQLIHLTRYIHLNPVTARLVEKPEEWLNSSYKEYLLEVNNNDRICKYDDVLDIEPSSYKEFVEDRIAYQRELVAMKALLIEG